MRNFLHGLLFFTVILLNTAIEIYAVPAKPGPVKYELPDGATIEIVLRGDEKVRWAETLDGYSILLNKEGYYEYAQLNEKGDMVRSGVRAYNQSLRSTNDMSLLSGIKKGVHFSKSQISMMRQIWQIKEKEASKAFPTTGSRKLVCILIGYTDLSFTKTQTEFDNLFNQVGYSTGGATGSVKDYYLENSYDQFNLTVDVAGPYTASNTMAYYGANDVSGWDLRPRELVTEAVYAANGDVNYSDYDNDSDGEVDGVYVIYAGYGEEAGASANTIWAHAWAISTVTLDGVDISSYSCSAELRGTSGTNITNIGVICHEFGHVLSAPDFYDTDYNDDGTWMDGTGDWDMMAGGSWNNNGATPAHHNMFTKYYYYGWVTPTTLSSAASITLNNSAENAEAYLINTATSNEYFIIENRQQVGFDADIPGSGLMIYHVDQDAVNSHDGSNDINATHPMYMYPVAQNSSYSVPTSYTQYGSINSSTCPWNGSGKTTFSDASTPSSKDWSGNNTNKPITNISISSGVASFDFMGGASASIIVSESSLDFEKVYSGYYSRPQSYTVTGSGLSANITVTAPTGIEVSSSCNSGYGSSVTLTQSGGNVNATVYARYTGGTVSANITHTSTGATTQNISISESASSTNMPASYYSSATGTGATLKTSLKNIIDGHSASSYTQLWTDFQSTDPKPNGKVWDMYSDVDECTTPTYEYTFSTHQCGTYVDEGDCYNREHSMPKSWFGVASGSENTYAAGTDLHHLVPTDGYVNGRRSSYVFGEVSSPTYSSDNGSKLGPNTYPGSSGTAFEPVDEYKGDFARIYFYMATRYEDDWVSRFGSSSEGNNMIDASSTYPAYDSWAVSMLLAWHNADPVDQKEMARNDAIYAIQGNRNPFIDNPSYAEDVWDPTIDPEPDNHPTGFSATASSDTQIGLSWTDATGSNLPDGYLILANTTGSFSAPSDTNDPSLDTDLSDGSAVVKALQGAQTYTFTGLSSETTYYFKAWPYTNSGSDIDFKTDGTPVTDNATTLATPITIESEDFASCPGDWTSESVSSSADWACGSGVNAINAYGSDEAAEDYLISPSLDLNAYTGEIMTFQSWTQYTDSWPDVELLYSTNYSGDASTATWNSLTATWSASNSQTWTGSGNVDLSGISGSSVRIAFRYTSSGTGSGTSSSWQIDDISITGYSAGPSLSVSTSALTGYTYVEGAGPSTSQNFTLSGSDLDGTEVTITAPTNYEVSKDNSSFAASQTVSYTAPTLNNTTIYVRLKAGLSTGTFNNENVTCADDGTAASKTVSNSGEVTAAPDPEPTNQATGFSATANGTDQVDLSWTDAVTGSQAPAGYLILANETGTFTPPSDGTDPSVDTDLSDGSAVVKVAHGTGASYSFTGLSASTQYYFKIWAYTNSGSNVDLKLDGTVPTANATTDAAAASTCEDFDSGLSGSYTTGTQTLSSGDWYTISVIAEAASASNGGSGSAARINDNTANASLRTPELNSVGTVTFWWRELNSGGGTFKLQKSYDGSLWSDVASQVYSGTTFTEYSYDVNDASNPVYVRILNDNNDGHLVIDDFCWTSYSGSATPTLTVSTSSLTGYSYVEGAGPSASQSFNLSGSDLDGTEVTVTAPTNYEVSLDNSSFAASQTVSYTAPTLNSTAIYVRLKASLSAGTYNSENVTCSDDGAAADVSVSNNGVVTNYADWCNLQAPASGSIYTGGTFNVYAQVYEAGVTEAAGQGTGVSCWIGYSTTDSDPSTWSDWVAASFNVQSGNNDEFVADIGSALPAGTYYYASRFTVDGTNYSYGGYSVGGGGIWDGSSYVSGTLTVTVNYPDWCNLQWPEIGSINLGDAYSVYARVYESGVTDGAGQGAGVTCWIGYNTADTDPSTWTNWVAATYNTDDGNNDEYSADLGAALSSGGTYYYASRFSVNGSDYSYGGFNAGGGNFWDGSTNVSGELIVASSGPCGTETFTNIPTTSSSSYLTRTWTGDGGGGWEATSARTDQTIDGKAICFKGYVLSPTVSGGVGDITITTKYPFSDGSSTLDVQVNGSSVGSVAISTSEQTITIADVNISGDINIKVLSDGTKRAGIDNLTWTCYSGVSNDSDSYVSTGGGAEPGTIASTVDTDGEEIAVFDFVFTDAGSGDGVATIIDQIQITQGSANGVADWTNAIAGAYLSGTDFGSDLAGTIAATTITFASNDMISIADGGNETYTLKIYLNTDLSGISDNDILEFAIDYTDITADGTGSSFGSGAPESGDANCAVDITATKLLFVQQPTNTIAGDAMSPAVTVEATDVNGNRDTDFTSNIEITSTGTLTGTPVSVAAVSGLATFSTLTHTALGSGITLNAERGTTNDWDVTSSTFNITGNTNSDIVFEPMAEPTNIDYTSYQATNISGGSDDIEVAQFTIRDGGATTDDDGSSTILTDISFDLSSWENIRRVALYDGITELGEEDGAATVTFTGLTIEATDDATKTFSVRVSFNTTVTDNQQFQFVVSAVTADGAGSGFAAADGGAAESSIDGDDNRIEVTATKLAFSQQPVNTVVNSEMSPFPEVEGQDDNDNLDLDYTETVSVTSTGTLSGAVSSAAVSGVASFSVTHTAAGTGLELTATQGAMSVTSSTFNIYAAPALIAYQGFEVDPASPADSWAYSGGTTTESSAMAYSGSQSCRIEGVSEVTFDNFDLTDFTSIVLSIAFAGSGPDSGEDLFIDISYDNGSTWEGEVKLVDGFNNTNLAFGSTNASDPTTVDSNPYTIAIDGSATQVLVKVRTEGLDAGEYYYIDEVKLTGISTIAVDEDSYVSAGAGAEPGTISSTVDTDGEEVVVFDFIMNDAGTADGLATIIDQIQITQGSANEVVDWTDAIAGAYLSGTDLGVDLAGTVNATNISFGSDDMISIADGGNETYAVKIYLNTNLTAITDNDILEFKLDYSNILTDYTGSAFGSGSTESGDANCAVDIVATHLQFRVQPDGTTFVNYNMSPNPKVKACDINGNVDVDYATDISITSSGTLAGTPVTESPTEGIGEFTIKHTATGTGLQLTAASGALTNGTSSTFDIIPFTYCTDLMISEYMEAPGTNTAIELFNGTGAVIDLSDYQLQSDHSADGWDATLDLSGTLAHGHIYLIVDEDADDLIDSLTAYNVSIDMLVPSSNNILKVSGDDPIGLFKTDGSKAFVLLDVVGDGIENFQEVNLTRNENVFAPNTTFTASEWTETPNTYVDLGYTDNPLPVVWSDVSATATNGSILVEWSTHSEINNDYFEIEHSLDNINYNVVGIVDGVGNSSVEQKYSYLHSGVVLGQNYYRIKQVDFDDAYTYSKVVTANLLDAEATKLNIEYVYISDLKQEMLINYAKNAQVTIDIYDITGKVLWSKTLILNADFEYVNIEDFNAIEGMFVVSVKDNYQFDSKKFIVK